jgi:hypothetical protein
MTGAPPDPNAVRRGQNIDVWFGDDGVARVIVTGSKLEGSDAQGLLNHLAQVSGGKRVPVLADIRKLRSITLDLRKVMASPEAGERLSAAAVVVSNPVNRMIGSFFLRLNHPPFDMQLFENEADALAWLASTKG